MQARTLLVVPLLASMAIAGLLLPGSALAKSDLTVTKVEVVPAKPAAGKSFQLEATVKNLGPDRAGARLSLCSFEVTAHIGSTKVGGDCDGGGLAAGATQVYTITVAGSHVPTAGTKKIKVTADGGGKVAETNEGNNSKEISVTFTKQGPDLVVNRVWVYPTPPFVNESATLYAEVQNVGSDPVSAPVKVTFYVSGSSVGSATISYLASGAKRTVFVRTTQGSDGSKAVKATADVGNAVTELDEGNNSRSVQITWRKKVPDLTVTDLTISPTKPVAGAAVRITATVKNIGVVSAGGLTNPPIVRFLIDGKQVGTGQPISFGLGVGKSNTEYVTVTVATPGSHKVKAVVDPDGKITEEKTTNNSLEKTFSWTGKLPDLHAYALTVNPGSPIVGSPTNFMVSVRNVGTDTATGPITVEFHVDGARVGTRTLNTLMMGRVAYVSHTYSVTSGAGPHKVKAVVNPSHNPAELSYTNNQIEKSVTWGNVPKPDLVVASLTATPASPMVGNRVKISATIKNRGSKGIGVGAPAFYVRFLVAGQQDSQQGKYLALSAGSTTIFTKEIVINTPGKRKIKVVADATDKVGESDEKNNEKEIEIEWRPLPRPDLTVKRVFSSPATATTGKSVRLYATVSNIGKVGYSMAIAVRFSIDGQVVKPDSTLTNGLAVHQVLLPWKPYSPAKEGVVLVSVTIDPDKKVVESDETNNTLEFKLKVVKPTVDADGDGVPADFDCDDGDKLVFPAHQGKPAAKEVCNGKDDNCDGKVDEGFDTDQDGYPSCGANPDCNDNDKAIHPGAPELCNGQDDNCDGSTDENLARPCSTACGNGQELCRGGQMRACDAPQPQTETCNNQDDDCNGTVDDGDLCPTGKICRSGSCVDKPPCSPACKSNEQCVSGQCVPKDPCAGMTCPPDHDCQAGKCVPREATTEPTPVEVPAAEQAPEPARDGGGTTPEADAGTGQDTGQDTGQAPDSADPGEHSADGSGPVDTATVDGGTTADSDGPLGGCNCAAAVGPDGQGALLAFLGLVLGVGFWRRKRRR